MTLGFRPRQRLRRRADFQRAYRTGKRARGRILQVVLCPNGLEDTRLGLSVGRAIWRSAVRRNRVRRIFREAFRLEYPELPRGLDLVLIPAAKGLDPELEATRAELRRLVRKAAERLPGARPSAPEAGSGPDLGPGPGGPTIPTR